MKTNFETLINPICIFLFMCNCDICGDRKSSVIVSIEGSHMESCDKCAEMGKIVSKIKKIEPIKKITPSEDILPEKRIVSDYARIMKNLREKNDMTQKEFAEKLNEKLSVIKNIEHGEFVPSIKFAEKVKNMFNVKLTEELKEENFLNSGEISQVTTLGDVIKIKKKKS